MYAIALFKVKQVLNFQLGTEKQKIILVSCLYKISLDSKKKYLLKYIL